MQSATITLIFKVNLEPSFIAASPLPQLLLRRGSSFFTLRSPWGTMVTRRRLLLPGCFGVLNFSYYLAEIFQEFQTYALGFLFLTTDP